MVKLIRYYRGNGILKYKYLKINKKKELVEIMYYYGFTSYNNTELTNKIHSISHYIKGEKYGEFKTYNINQIKKLDTIYYFINGKYITYKYILLK